MRHGSESSWDGPHPRKDGAIIIRIGTDEIGHSTVPLSQARQVQGHTLQNWPLSEGQEFLAAKISSLWVLGSRVAAVANGWRNFPRSRQQWGWVQPALWRWVCSLHSQPTPHIAGQTGSFLPSMWLVCHQIEPAVSSTDTRSLLLGKPHVKFTSVGSIVQWKYAGVKMRGTDSEDSRRTIPSSLLG